MNKPELFEKMINSGWEFKVYSFDNDMYIHLELEHPNGGRQSVFELRGYSAPLEQSERKELADWIAYLLNSNCGSSPSISSLHLTSQDANGIISEPPATTSHYAHLIAAALTGLFVYFTLALISSLLY